MFKLPNAATAPFCPSEVRGTVQIDPAASLARNMFAFAGPGLMVSVGYMDPGNWATDIEAGSRFGNGLLFIVLFSSLAAVLLQCLSAHLGVITGKDLARLSGERYGPATRVFLWLMAELSIVACDLAEVLGGALAFHLLLGVPLLVGVVLTIFDTIIVLGFKGRNFRALEAIVLGLVATIGLCFGIELFFIKPYWPDVAAGFVPSAGLLMNPKALPLAVGIIGATVMPHNLYLHSSIVQTRVVRDNDPAKSQALRFTTLDTVLSLFFALFINAAILILAAGAFHANGYVVTEIQDAYHLLQPVVGGTAAGVLFAVALLASGQSSTVTGTIAGQVILEGFMNFKIPCWQRRLITRTLALLPALVGIWIMGSEGIGRMLVISQIVLCLQLPFAMYPLIRCSGDKKLMGQFRASPSMLFLSWIIFSFITAGNVWLFVQLAGF